MTYQNKLVANGVWSEEARLCAGGDLQNAISLATSGNNTPTGAVVITGDMAVIGTAAAGTNSAILSNYGSGFLVVFNNTAVTVNVFPPTGGSINGLAANASFPITANKSTTFITPDGLFWLAQHAG
ncbi:hypothetical protein ACO0LG_08690 [Undibacterium sp. Ji42W]|uniref:hypothetical protein n=1 Tax=Undibacterium sp. Ji42W TaxID=3413039 RepID=UPI003BF430FA